MNLTTAFIMRAKIKEKLEKEITTIYSIPAYTKDEYEKNEYNQKYFDGDSFENSLEKYKAEYSKFMDFKFAIEHANLKVRSRVLELSQVEHEITMYKKLEKNLSTQSSVRIEYKDTYSTYSNREQIEIPKLPTYDYKSIVKTIKLLEQKKNRIEKNISTANAATNLSLAPELEKWGRNISTFKSVIDWGVNCYIYIAIIVNIIRNTTSKY